jgi:hypothetical protein
MKLTFLKLAGADGYRAAILAQPRKEAELADDDCFSQKQTRVHVFVFLSCPIPFCKSLRYTLDEHNTSWGPASAGR